MTLADPLRHPTSPASWQESDAGAGEERNAPPGRPVLHAAGARATVGWKCYLGMLAVVAGCTAICALVERHLDLSNLTMVYLLGVVVSAMAFGRGPAIAAAFVSVAVFDFGFVPPRFTFRVSDTQYLVTFGVMLVVAAVIGTLTAGLRRQLEFVRARERRSAALYRLSHDLAVHSTTAGVLAAAVDRIAEVLNARVAMLLPDGAGDLHVAAGDARLLGDDRVRADAQRAFDNGRLTGAGSGSPRETEALHLPLEAAATLRGVLSVRPTGPAATHDPERLHLARALASQTALALERCRLAEEAERARMDVETERARSALLSSVSHDLRTPLAAITGAASGLREDSGALSPAARVDLVETISEEAQRLNRLIGNLLEMTRLESGALSARKSWHSLEEIVGAALTRLEPMLGDRPIRVSLPDDLPLVPLDEVLFEQVVSNLVENAHKYTPRELPIDVSAVIDGRELSFEVADRGSGLGPGPKGRLFDKFYRGSNAVGQPGVGLGLAICRGIVQAHGGRIVAANRAGGGAVFTVRLPLEGEPPAVAGDSFEEDGQS